MENTLKTITKTTTISGSLNIELDWHLSTISDNNELVDLNELVVDEVEILEQKKNKNGQSGLECELLINQNDNPIFELDVNGEIYVSDYGDFFEINENGHLEFEL
jgi:hypothetical protein